MSELLGLEPETYGVLKRCGDVIVYASEVEHEEMHDGDREPSPSTWRRPSPSARERPRDDLISVLLTSSPEGDALTHEELLSLCFLLTVAGTETTTSGMGNALLALDHFTADRARIVADRTLLPTAVDEILRYDSPVQGLSRVATEDVEISRHEDARRVRGCTSCSPRPTGTPRCSRTPTASTSPAHPTCTSRSGSASTTASARAWPAPRSGSGSTSFLDRFPEFAVRRDGVVRLHSDTNRGFAQLPVQLVAVTRAFSDLERAELDLLDERREALVADARVQASHVLDWPSPPRSHRRPTIEPISTRRKRSVGDYGRRDHERDQPEEPRDHRAGVAVERDQSLRERERQDEQPAARRQQRDVDAAEVELAPEQDLADGRPEGRAGERRRGCRCAVTTMTNLRMPMRNSSLCPC